MDEVFCFRQHCSWALCLQDSVDFVHFNLSLSHTCTHAHTTLCKTASVCASVASLLRHTGLNIITGSQDYVYSTYSIFIPSNMFIQYSRKIWRHLNLMVWLQTWLIEDWRNLDLAVLQLKVVTSLSQHNGRVHCRSVWLAIILPAVTLFYANVSVCTPCTQ